MSMGVEQGCPLFSVVITVHNRAELFRRALASVVKQSGVDFETIVVDDGSTEDIAGVVAEFPNHPVRLLRQEKSGQAAAANAGVDVARGKYIVFLDSDDEALDGWLEGFAGGFESGDANLVCCGIEDYRVRPDGTVTVTNVLPSSWGAVYGNRAGMFLSGAFSMPRELFLEVGGYTVGTRAFLQTDFFLKLMAQVGDRLRINNLMKPLVRIHRHGDSRIRTNPEAQYYGARQLIERHGDRLSRDPTDFANYLTCAGINAARLGRHKESVRYLVEAVKVEPRRLSRWGRVAVAAIKPLSIRVWPPAAYSVSDSRL